MRKRVAYVAVLLAVGLAGCGGSKNGTHTIRERPVREVPVDDASQASHAPDLSEVQEEAEEAKTEAEEAKKEAEEAKEEAEEAKEGTEN